MIESKLRTFIIQPTSILRGFPPSFYHVLFSNNSPPGGISGKKLQRCTCKLLFCINFKKFLTSVV